MPSDPKSLKARLEQFLKDNCVLRDRQYILASGESSDVYIDARIATLDPEGSFLISSIFFEEIAKRENVAAVGCAWSVGGASILSAVIAKSFRENKPLNGLIVRTGSKTYGTEKIIEGNLDGLFVEGNVSSGQNVVMVEDVVNTGKSILKAIGHLKEKNVNVCSVFSVMDRGEETKKMFEQEGYEFFSIFKLDDLLSQTLDSARKQHVQKHQQEYQGNG